MAINWRDSDTYLAIREEGAVEALHSTVLVLGRKCFSEPDQASQDSVLAITDLPRPKRLRDRLLDVNTWQELLATP